MVHNATGLPKGLDLTITNIDGERVALIQPTIPDDAPTGRKQGLAARRTANATGQCPACGARMQMPNRAARRALRIPFAVFEHEDDCPALLDGAA